MVEKDKIPEIRFAWFTDAWEQRKLEKIVDRVSNISNEAGFPRLEYEDIISGSGKLNKDIYKKESSKTGIGFEAGDILFGKLRPYLKNWLLADFQGIAVGDFWVLRSDVTDSKFLYYLIQTPKYYEVANQSTGTKMPRSDWNVVSKTEFLIPDDKLEQQKIGEFFANIDNLITLHQRKYDKLVIVKKSMLEKMFPKDGANVPEVRFAGFTDAWEQRKLSELTSLITKGTTPLDKSGNGKINYVKIESIDSSSGKITITSTISEEEHNGYLKRSQLQEGDVLFSIAGTLGRVTAVNKDVLPANTNQALAIIRLKNCNLNYIITYLKGKAVSEFVKKNPTVGAQPNLSLEQVGNLEIALPETDEQEQIGDFFFNLDNLITLHQRELEKLKNIKKSLLEKMFV